VAARAPRRRHAVLAVGDALLFDGALLHRTQRLPGAAARRASVELRFFADPPPARVAHERLLPF
jgi:ectoine hydroxylase-related dioxygenase (phytanoyl-CoA dioxygenase family)